ncbi:MAG: hypothetical protein KAT43_02235 [Nanoarchaeota archaeon]|nr:hypothetical protein [Nanoarchaeota archaeon]
MQLSVRAPEGDKELFRLIESHNKKRPNMGIHDLYKMMYQSVLGPGHIMTDDAREKLIQEFEGVEASDEEELVENISLDRSIVRINLRPFKFRDLSVDKLFEAMKKSAEEIRATKEDFIDLWSEVQNLCSYGYIEVKIRKFQVWVEAWKYPLGSHSMVYETIYKPAYRVVKKDVFDGIF